MDLIGIVAKLAIGFLPLLFALSFHEYAHAQVAKWRGDDTAEQLGRLTLNPSAHADLVGTYILPIMSTLMNANFLLGWAKPVPVNPRNLYNYRTDMFWVAFAGPLSNILLALISTLFLFFLVKASLFPGYQESYVFFFQKFVQVNLMLAVFNMIPLHPLDGGKVLARFLPTRWNIFLEQNEMYSGFLLMILVFAGFLWFLSYPVVYGVFFLMSLIGVPVAIF